MTSELSANVATAMVSILATPVTDTYGCERRHLFLSWHLDRVSVDARGHSDGSQCWQIRTSRSQQLPVGSSRDDHVSISITSAILPPFDYLPLVRNTPAPFTSATTRTIARYHPLLGFAYVRPAVPAPGAANQRSD